MKIINVTSSIDRTHGGIANSVSQLCTVMLNDEEFTVPLYCLESGYPLIKELKNNEHNLLSFFKSNVFGYSKGLNNALNTSDAVLFHGHGLWEVPVHQMVKVARKNKKPYIIAPRGMLEAWSLQQNSFKKQLGMSFFQKSDLKNAACLQATAIMEAESIRALGFSNPIAIIPNGINLKDFPKKNNLNQEKSKKILFLSRIHYKKGIEVLIKAWAELPNTITNGWSIDIVGNGKANYLKKLKTLISSYGLAHQINIVGPLFGKAKINAYQRAQLFVLPSYSENFGVVIAEALACGTPVITTKGTPWKDLEDYNCGWWIDEGVNPLKESLIEALILDSAVLQKMGMEGRKLIETKYTMANVVSKMKELYQWILGNSDKPDFIV